MKNVVHTIKKNPRLGGAVYVLPNLLTTGNLYFGFFSIVKSLQGSFGWAAAAIFIASIFDVLDGRVARLTKGTSEFGVQYDSLCDLVSFGVAPSFLMYQFALHDAGRVGWIVCFIYLACGTLRLARFNVQSSIGKANGDFVGLPIPMAAATIASYVAWISDLQGTTRGSWIPAFIKSTLTDELFIRWFLLVVGIGLAILMVSNLAFRSHKTLKFSGLKPFRILAIFVGIIGLVAVEPEMVGFVAFFGYAISGPFEWTVGWKKPTDDDDIFTPNSDGSSIIEPD